MDNPESVLARAEGLLAERQLTRALASFDLAEQSGADPDRCSGGRWMAHMLLGDFASAWKQSDRLRVRGSADPHRFWNGEGIDGKQVMVRCLHGLGDSVQFFRYLPLLRQKAAKVIVEVPPKMLEIAPAFDGVEEVITWGEQAPAQPPAWDVQIEVTELAYVFRTEVRDLPIATNYLRLARLSSRCAARIFCERMRPRVGIVWSCGTWNLSRSMRIHELAPLFKQADVDFWNLQGGEVRREWNTLPPTANLCDAPEHCGDAGLVELARFITEMDLVITVDTLSAHLGGALGRPTWVMLQRAADWRWMADRDRSPWYPSLRLFRQARDGDWSGVVACVKHTLSRWSAEKGLRETAA